MNSIAESVNLSGGRRDQITGPHFRRRYGSEVEQSFLGEITKMFRVAEGMNLSTFFRIRNWINTWFKPVSSPSFVRYAAKDSDEKDG